MINIFAGCTTREQAAKALSDAQELGVATPDDDILFELGVDVSGLLDFGAAPSTPSTPSAPSAPTTPAVPTWQWDSTGP